MNLIHPNTQLAANLKVSPSNPNPPNPLFLTAKHSPSQPRTPPLLNESESKTKKNSGRNNKIETCSGWVGSWSSSSRTIYIFRAGGRSYAIPVPISCATTMANASKLNQVLTAIATKKKEEQWRKEGEEVFI